MIPFAMWTPSVWELGIVLVLVLVLFGAGKLPTAFTQLGKAVKNFRDAQKDDAMDVSPGPTKELVEDDSVREAEEVEKAKA